MASDPFRITGPAVISFSGGRTSAYMLWRILQAHGGTLPTDVVVIFANTGKERVETLDFVEECSRRWGVPVTWLEYRYTDGFAVVTYETASRAGEPFAALIAARKFLPNPVTRFCTTELKVRVIQKYVKSCGWGPDYEMVIGLRADEPHRVAKGRRPSPDGYDKSYPLADAGLTERDVLTFWAGQPFDLRLRSHEGNCDLCFLKGAGKIETVMRDRPELAAWWIGMESTVEHRDGGTDRFRRDRPSYAALLERSRRPTLFPLDLAEPDELGGACHCTD